MKDYANILKFWFPSQESIFLKFWFSSEYDEYITKNFKNNLIELENLKIIDYNNADDLLAQIIVLDQFSRNIYRGKKDIIKNDPKALSLAKKYFENNYFKNHKLNQIIFALMPFRHSEDLDNQSFVLDFLNKNKEDNKLFIKFYNASIKSYNTIKEHGYFPSRKNLI